MNGVDEVYVTADYTQNCTVAETSGKERLDFPAFNASNYEK